MTWKKKEKKEKKKIAVYIVRVCIVKREEKVDLLQ